MHKHGQHFQRSLAPSCLVFCFLSLSFPSLFSSSSITRTANGMQQNHQTRCEQQLTSNKISWTNFLSDQDNFHPSSILFVLFRFFSFFLTPTARTTIETNRYSSPSFFSAFPTSFSSDCLLPFPLSLLLTTFCLNIINHHQNATSADFFLSAFSLSFFFLVVLRISLVTSD